MLYTPKMRRCGREQLKRTLEPVLQPPLARCWYSRQRGLSRLCLNSVPVLLDPAEHVAVAEPEMATNAVALNKLAFCSLAVGRVLADSQDVAHLGQKEQAVGAAVGVLVLVNRKSHGSAPCLFEVRGLGSSPVA